MNEMAKQIREQNLGAARTTYQDGDYWVTCRILLHLHREQIEEPVIQQIEVAEKLLVAHRYTQDGDYEKSARALFEIEGYIAKDTRNTRNTENKMGFDIYTYTDTGKDARKMELKVPQKLFQDGNYEEAVRTLVEIYKGFYLTTTKRVTEPMSRKLLEAIGLVQDGNYEEAARALFAVENDVDKRIRSEKVSEARKLYRRGNHIAACDILFPLYRYIIAERTMDEFVNVTLMPWYPRFSGAMWSSENGYHEDAARALLDLETEVNEGRLSLPDRTYIDPGPDGACNGNSTPKRTNNDLVPKRTNTGNPADNFETRRERDMMDQQAKIDQLPSWQQREINKRRDDYSDTRRIP